MADFIVAVTGGIASGKSAVCAMFEREGVVVADADVIAHAIVAPGAPALAEIRARFGDAILRPDGSLDRTRLRELVFTDDSARSALESLTHPRIRAELERQCRAAAGPYAIAAIPLLAESGSEPERTWPWLRRVLVVDAPEALQRARLLARDGIDAVLAARMIAAQASRGQRLALASDVIINDAGRGALDGPVRRLHARYRARAAP